MKSDFLLAITQLSAEKNLPRDVVLAAVETALASAYRKEHFVHNQNVSVKISQTTGKVQVWAEKTVVDSPTDNRRQISLDEARRIKPDVEIDDTVMAEATPSNAGRIAAQTAKQVILQRLHEAEHTAIFDEYADKEGDIISGVVQHIEGSQTFVDLGRTEAVLPAAEQVRGERYRIGQRLKFYLLEVARTNKGPRVILSRSHPNLVKGLFELEVPEVYSGVVEIKSVAREAGHRSKVAVATHQEGIDPIGCCVGLRGIRIQNIVSELNNEKLDVVMWNPDASVFIASALSPAQVLNVDLDNETGVATVVVPDRQLSLAIGKDGQNARLAAKLTGWRIDIKSASVAEAEKAAMAEKAAERLAKAEPEAVFGEATPEELEAILEPALIPDETVEEAVEVPKKEAEPVEEELVPLPSLDTEFVPQEVPFEPQAAEAKPLIRFAEDILPPTMPKSGAKAKKKKKTDYDKEGAKEGIRVRKGRREVALTEDDEYEPA